MFDEMSFLFGTSRQVTNQFNTTKDSSRINLSPVDEVSNSNDGVQSVRNKIEYDGVDKIWKYNKYSMTKDTVQNYIQSDVNKSYSTSGKNPYIDLLDNFNGVGKNSSALKLNASDFTYLRDIGVFPINRLMILRRFPEGAVVPVDLNDLEGTEPISTVIGWVKEDNDLLSFSANEKWIQSTTPLHVLIQQIIQSEFGIDIGGIFPVPGWGTGFMFGLLNKMGLTDYSANQLPIGDANLLREGITRPHEEQGLLSKFSFSLETVYEQKYVAGIDPGSAFQDILSNSLNMGTSDIRFLGKAGNEIAKAITKANNNPSDPEGWKYLIIKVVETAVEALKGTFTKNAKKGIAANAEAEKTAKAEFGITEDTDTNTNTGTGVLKADDENNDKDKNKKANESAANNLGKINLVNGLISTILASTVARYQWPIRGAINQLTGEAGTPWHLTIGNPNAPLLSMNNIKVNNVDVTMGPELSYNDMSKFMTVKIDLEQGRNMGKQEIEKMFGVTYKRYYKKVNNK